MKLNVIGSSEELVSFKDDYDTIFCQAINSTPFQSFAWIYNYLKYFQGMNIPYIGSLPDVAIFPMWIKNYIGINALEFVGTRGTDYLNFIINKEKLESVSVFLKDFVQNDALDIIYLEDILETEEAFEYLEQESQKLGLIFQKENNCPVHFIDLPKTTDEYFYGLSKRMQTDFHYDVRYMEKHCNDKLDYTVKSDMGSLRTHIKLHQKRQTANGFSGSYYKQKICDFMNDFISDVPGQNRRISELSIGGKVIASILSVVHNNKVFLITVGFDPEYEKYNPGKILFIKDIMDCIECGYNPYDLSRGDEKYKLKLNSVKKNNLRIYISKNLIIDQFKENYEILNRGKGYNPDI
jgi:CelD/BcsL family acetyltransferase involved in cellulose biosynthesis